MTSSAAFATAAVVGAGLTVVVRRLSRILGVVALPSPIVPQHTAPVSTLGGVAVAGAIAVALFAGAADRPSPALILGAVLFLAIGALDDVRELGVGGKLALQTVATAPPALLGLNIPLSGLGPVDAVAAALWILVLANAVNLADVCDGVVAGVAVIAFTTLGVIAPDTDRLAFVVAGACLGFLVLNAPPASIFLGNAGSQLLGFLLAVLSIESLDGKASWDRLASLTLIAGVFLFEVAFVFVARMRKRLPWWRASSDHVSLQLLAAGFSRWTTVLVMWLAAAALALAAWSLDRFEGLEVLAVVAGALGGGLVAGRLVIAIGWRTGG